MKRVIIALIFIIAGFELVKAQIYAGYGCKDPDAWFDKEIYFVATNEYGDLSNVNFLVNRQDNYYIENWKYGETIQIDKSSMKKGSSVELYVNGKYVDSWYCSEDKPSLTEKIWDNYNRSIIKGSVKLLLKIIRK